MLQPHEILTLQLLGLQTPAIIECNKIVLATGWNNEIQYLAKFLCHNTQYLKAGSEDSVEQALNKAQQILFNQNKKSIHTISYFDPDYPACFKQLQYNAPPLIYLIGNELLLEKENRIAIIGSRHINFKGYENSYKLGAWCGKSQIIVSGLALGCDTAAHEGCLSIHGKTIAVVATGLHKIHPRQNESLQTNILNNGGLILSEQSFGTKANPKRLISRCRLQAALANSIIVTQCLINSGTMHTVQFGRQYGKTIYAIREIPNEYNSGNCFLVDSGQAKPIIIN